MITEERISLSGIYKYLLQHPMMLLVSILSLEALVAISEPGNSAILDWLSSVMKYFIPAISNFDANSPIGHRVQNFIALGFLFLPIKIGCGYLWLKQNIDEARKWIIVSPLSGRSIGASLVCLITILGITMVGSWVIGNFGDVYWTGGKASPLEKIEYPSTLSGGLPMWLAWSLSKMIGLAAVWALLIVTARDWMLWIVNRKQRK